MKHEGAFEVKDQYMDELKDGGSQESEKQ